MQQALQLAQLTQRTTKGSNGLLDTKQKRSDWQRVLAAQRGNLVYVDLWASWCAPCRAEMPASHQLRRTLAGHSIRFIYLSLDEDPNAWLRANQEIGLAQGESYLVLDSFRSAFARQYHLKAIPRYLLFDKRGRLLSATAKRPSHPLLKADLLRLVP